MKLFRSFFIGGYECADLINNQGCRVDLLAASGHDVRIDEDYRLLKEAGIHTVREGIRWSVVEKQPQQYDWSEVIHRIEAAQKAGIQQLWDICHFGYPDGLMPSHPQFAERFVGVCRAFTQLYRSLTEDPLIITPVNEISFISWLGGEARGTVPFAINSGFDVKYFLCRAAIRGIRAIKELDPAAKVLMVEPLVKVHPQTGQPVCDTIRGYNEAQFQAVDIVTGRMCPELGGHPDLVDLVGFNYYYNNMWEHGGSTLPWARKEQYYTFPQLLLEAYQRYHKPVIISETGHFGEHRPNWMEQITTDCMEAMEAGVDLRGICIYPVLDRPDWDILEKNIPCGIWTYTDTKERVAEADYLDCVKGCVAAMESYRIQQTTSPLKLAALAV